MDDPEHLEPEEDEDESGPLVTVEIVGLSLYTHHGVGEAERELGQRLVFDLSFELSDCDATLTDRVEDTVDYADVCQQVALAAQEKHAGPGGRKLHGRRLIPRGRCASSSVIPPGDRTTSWRV